jgi:putative DNA primase/helicase
VAALDSTPLDAVPVLPEWVTALTGARTRSANGKPDWEPTGIASSAEVQRLVSEGDWTPGEQRATLCRCARSLMGTGMSHDEVVAQLWNALRDSNRTGAPWERADIERLVKEDFAKNPPPTPLRIDTIRSLTDDGNARRFADRFGDVTRWDPYEKTWLTWGDGWWVPRTEDYVKGHMLEVARDLPTEAAKANDDGLRGQILSWGIRSLFATRITGALNLAKGQRELLVHPNDFDVDPYVLNCRNGVLDLRTGELSSHRASYMLRQQTACAYDLDARSADWERVLNDALGGHAGLIDYVQKLFGYCLTGSVKEESLFFLFGAAQAGKTTLLEAFGRMLGTYSRIMRFQSLVQIPYASSGGAASEDIARLHRARFVSVSESEANAKLAVGLVKSITGGEKLNARYLHQNSFEFVPEFKLFLASNHRPQLPGARPDDGIWRRIKMIPFEHPVAPEARDPDIKVRLTTREQEWAGILAWAVEGCLRWQKEGLGDPPQASRVALTDYQENEDRFAQFLSDCVVARPDDWVSLEQMYHCYIQWAHGNGLRQVSKLALGNILEERGLHRGKKDIRRGGKRTSVRVWLDVEICPPSGIRIANHDPCRGST